MVVPVLLAAAAALVVVWAVVSDDDVVEVPSGPRWDRWPLLPDPGEVSGVRFSTAWRGYAPAEVEDAFERVRVAYTELWDALGPVERERAARRLGMRSGGVELSGVPVDADAPSASDLMQAPRHPPATSWSGIDADLAQLAALAVLDARARRARRADRRRRGAASPP